MILDLYMTLFLLPSQESKLFKCRIYPHFVLVDKSSKFYSSDDRESNKMTLACGFASMKDKWVIGSKLSYYAWCN